MAFSALARAVATKTQAASGTFEQPSSSADTYPCANARLTIDTISAENPEYTGTIHRPGEIVLGSRATLTFSTLLRSPGGASPPVAGAHIPGRLFVAAGWTENILSAAIPVAPEALGVGSTPTSAVLGTSAAATADLYRGLALDLSDNGATYLKRLTAIRGYSAAKTAALFETLGAAPAANYQIPKQLAYQLSKSAPNAILSQSAWLGKIRYDLVDMVPTAMRINLPVAGRDANEFPAIEWTVEGSVAGWDDEDSPEIVALGNPPPFRDGDFAIAGLKLGGSSISIDLGIRAAYPPNPNFEAGYEPGLIVETRRSATTTLNHNLKSVVDFQALAQAQAYHGLWAQWGFGAGSAVMVNIPDGRFKFPNPGDGTEILDQQLEMLIDGADKAITIAFPY